MKHIENIYNEISLFKGYIHKFNKTNKIILVNFILIYIILYYLFFGK